MLNNGTAALRFKVAAFEAFAEVAKAWANPTRLQLVDLLVQGPRRVEQLAEGITRPIASTSQHLQVLKRARLVCTERRGTAVVYRLAPGVSEAFVTLTRLAESRSPVLAAAFESFHHAMEAPDCIDRNALVDGLQSNEIVLVDVRPAKEHQFGHIPGSLSMPLGELEERVGELPVDKLVAVCCRGPFCTYAAQAVRWLRAHGISAVRFEHSVADWAQDGGAVAVGAS